MDWLNIVGELYGSFLTPKKYIDASYDCFASFSIAYYQAAHSNNWYDEFYAGENENQYIFTYNP